MDTDAIIARVLGRYGNEDAEKHRKSRAVLILDATTAVLERALREANVHVIMGRTDTWDSRQELLAHRMLVTKSTAGYLDDAPVLDYGIIGLDALPTIGTSPNFDVNATARMISIAISDWRLPTERSGFVIMLHPEGRHVFRRID